MHVRACVCACVCLHVLCVLCVQEILDQYIKHPTRHIYIYIYGGMIQVKLRLACERIGVQLSDVVDARAPCKYNTVTKGMVTRGPAHTMRLLRHGY